MMAKTNNIISLPMKITIAMVFVFCFSLFFAESTYSAEWKNDPANCSAVLGSVDCSGGGSNNKICGVSNGSGICYSPMTKAQFSTLSSGLSQTVYSGSFTAGFILDCQASVTIPPAVEPYCNNSNIPGVNTLWCNANTGCRNTDHVMTRCFAGTWAGEASPYECATSSPSPSTDNCVSGWVNCDGNVNNCETQIGGACSIGGLNGEWNAMCNCVVEPQHFITGINAEFATSSPLLWGTQYGDGDLVSIAKNGVSTSTFMVSNSGQVGIGLTSVHAAAALEVSSTSRGVLFPRLTTGQRDGIATPPEGLLIYNIENNQFEYYATSSWLAMGAGGAITYTADGEGLELSGNQFYIELDGTTLFKSASGLRLSTTTVAEGTYGSSTEMVIFTVDAYGRLTAVSTTTLAFSSSDLMDSSTIAYLNQDQTFIGQNTFANTTTFVSSTMFNATSTHLMGIRSQLYCDADGNNCFDPTSGWAAPMITQINTTTYTTNGSFATGTFIGYQAANNICHSEYPGSHICETDEILSVIRSQNISYFGTGNIDGAWIAEGPPGFTANANDCNGWTNSQDTRYGPFWIFDSVGGGMGWLAPCNGVKPLACCQ
jgi:hypothetical protein